MRSAAFVLVFFFALPAHGLSPKTFEVPKLGGTFEMSVLRDHMTPLVFPAAVTKTIGWSTHGFSIKRFKSDGSVPPPNIVTIEPDENASWASLTIHAGPLEVHLLITAVNEPAKAHSSVLFVPREAEQQFRARVDRAVAKRLQPLQSEAEDTQNHYKRLIARQDALITDRAMQMIANAVRTDVLHHRTPGRSIRATQRIKHRVLRLHEIRWLGQHAFIVVSVSNQGPNDDKMGTISLRKNGVLLPIAISFSPTDKQPETILSSTTLVGVIALANANELIGQQATLRIDGPKGHTLAIQVPLVADHE